jgi:peptide/nickel transport system substrate-binding protein
VVDPRLDQHNRPLPYLVWGSLAAAFLAVWVSACQRSAPASATAPAVLTIGTAFPPMIDLSVGTRAVALGLTAESAVSIGQDGRPVPRAADWTWASDRLGLTLHLKPGIKFHDGTPLTNTIAAEILRKALVQKKGGVSTTVNSIEAVGSSDILVRTSQPEGFLLSDLAANDFRLPRNPTVSIGPFKMESNGAPIVLRAFDDYRLGRPKIDQIEIRAYATQRASWVALMRGEINMLHDVSRDGVEFVEAESSLQTHSFLRPYYVALAFNVRHPILGKKEVRQALNEAVNRDQIVNTAMRKRAEAANGPVWPQHWAFVPGGKGYSQDADSARMRLDAVGLTEGREPSNGGMPSRFHFTCLVPSDAPQFDRIALLLQKQLFDVGVDMEVELASFSDITGKRLQSGQFDAALIEFTSSRSLSYNYLFWHSPPPGAKPMLNTGYKAADDALDRLRKAISDDEVRSAVADLQQTMHDDPPALFLAWTKIARALSKDFVVPDEGQRDILGTIRLWQPLSPQQRAAR